MKYNDWSQHHDKVCKRLSAYAQAKGVSYVDLLDILGAGMTLGQAIGFMDGAVCDRIAADMHNNLARLASEVQP